MIKNLKIFKKTKHIINEESEIDLVIKKAFELQDGNHRVYFSIGEQKEKKRNHLKENSSIEEIIDDYFENYDGDYTINIKPNKK